MYTCKGKLTLNNARYLAIQRKRHKHQRENVVISRVIFSTTKLINKLSENNDRSKILDTNGKPIRFQLSLGWLSPPRYRKLMEAQEEQEKEINRTREEPPKVQSKKNFYQAFSLSLTQLLAQFPQQNNP